MSLIYNFLRKPPNKNALFFENYFIEYQTVRKKFEKNLLIYNKLTEIFADFRHFGRTLILLIFSYLRYKSSTKTTLGQHAGGKGQFLIVNKKLRTTAARAAVHVVNIRPSTFNYYLFLYGGSAVEKRHHHRRRPPLAKAVYSAAFIHIEKGLFRAQNSLFWRLFSRQWHIM